MWSLQNSLADWRKAHQIWLGISMLTVIHSNAGTWWLATHPLAPPVVTYLWPRSSLASEGEHRYIHLPEWGWPKSNILSLWVRKDKTGGSFCRIAPFQGLTYLCWQVLWLEVWNLRRVQILLTPTHPSSLLVELAQQIDCETSLLLEPEQELKP